MDKKALVALNDDIEKHPFRPTVKEGAYGCQIEIKPLK